MSDRFGVLQFPVPAGELATALEVLLAFSRAVLVSRMQAAWADIAPIEPQEIVASTFAEDPQHCAFPAPLVLPALFAFENKGQFDPVGVGDGYERATATITLWWLFPDAQRERRRPMDRVPQAAARTLASALSDARHPAYVHADDLPYPTFIREAHAAPLVDAIYSGSALDGKIGGGEWPTPGLVSFTTTVGAWDTTRPIVVTTMRQDGSERAESVYLTNATGPEIVEAVWIGTQVVSVAVPAQPSSVGTLAIGRALAPSCEYGSSLRALMGVHRLVVTGWTRKDLSIAIRDGKAIVFDGLCFDIAIEETRDRSAAALGYAYIADDSAHGIITSVAGGVSAEVFDV